MLRLRSMTHIFISYSRQDEDFVQYLAKSLKAKNFEVWLDIERLDVGEVWDEELENAVTDCYAFVIIMSANSKASKWVKNELGLAQELNKPIFPVQLSGEIWWNLKHLQAEDMTKGLEAKLSPRFLNQLTEAQTIKMDEPKADEPLQNKSDAKADNEQDKPLPYTDNAISQPKWGCTAEIVIKVMSAIVIPLLAIAFGNGVFFKVFPPTTTTPTITTVTLTDTTTPVAADTATPPATFSPTPCCTETPEPSPQADTDFESWLLQQGYESSQSLEDVADSRLEYIADLGISELDTTNLCLNRNGETLQRELAQIGYSQEAFLIVNVEDGDINLADFQELLGNLSFSEFGIAYVDGATGFSSKSYLILILGNTNNIDGIQCQQ